MATDPEHVCLWWETGSGWPTAKTALMTHQRHWLCTARQCFDADGPC